MSFFFARKYIKLIFLLKYLVNLAIIIIRMKLIFCKIINFIKFYWIRFFNFSFLVYFYCWFLFCILMNFLISYIYQSYFKILIGTVLMDLMMASILFLIWVLSTNSLFFFVFPFQVSVHLINFFMTQGFCFVLCLV